ncbi:unnamed protein product [Ectocarpus sp. 6 AP-2014]
MCVVVQQRTVFLRWQGMFLCSTVCSCSCLLLQQCVCVCVCVDLLAQGAAAAKQQKNTVSGVRTLIGQLLTTLCCGLRTSTLYIE